MEDRHSPYTAAANGRNVAPSFARPTAKVKSDAAAAEAPILVSGVEKLSL